MPVVRCDEDPARDAPVVFSADAIMTTGTYQFLILYAMATSPFPDDFPDDPSLLYAARSGTALPARVMCVPFRISLPHNLYTVQHDLLRACLRDPQTNGFRFWVARRVQPEEGVQRIVHGNRMEVLRIACQSS